MIDTKQNRNIITLDIPNSFVQTPIPETKEKVLMKKWTSSGLFRIFIYRKIHTICKNKKQQKKLCVEMKKTLYGMMLSSLYFYRQFQKNIGNIGFEINPHDVCVANRKVNGTQQTITWHVDNIKVSRKERQVNMNFYKWCEKIYGSNKNGHIKIKEGNKHNYLAMTLDYSKKDCVKIDITNYINKMLEEFPYELINNVKCPWTSQLFNQDCTSKNLGIIYKETFHTFVMKCMFLAKQARPDILTGISFLTTRVKSPKYDDWNKLIRILSNLNGTRKIISKLRADDVQNLTWYVDALFGVHNDMKSHTGSMFTLGKGGMCNDSTKQKIITQSSTKAELVTIDDRISKIIWMKHFIESQGFNVKVNVIYQDNQSCIKLAEIGKESSGKRMGHFYIKYFYITDLIKRPEVSIQYCASNDMLADFFTTPVIGKKFNYMQDKIMNHA